MPKVTFAGPTSRSAVPALPERMADHWWWRPGCRLGRRQYVWHILFGGHPDMRETARDFQARLAGLPGLDLVPEPWLHLTTHIVGFADEIADSEAREIVGFWRARKPAPRGR